MSEAFEVAVVVPVRDGLPDVLEAVASALAQTLAPVEVIVVDDGSSDGSAAALERRFGSRIRILAGRMGSAAAARNAGWRAVRAPYIAFLDADDLWKPDKLAVASASFDAAPTADWFFSDGEFRTLDGQTHASWLSLFADFAEPWCGSPIEQLFDVNFVLTSSVIVRRAALEAAGGFDEGLTHAEDLDLWIRLSRRGLATASGRALVRYQHREGGLTRQTGNRLRGGATLFARLAGDASLPGPLRRLARRRGALYHYKLGLDALRGGAHGEARREFAAAWLFPERALAVALGWAATLLPRALFARLRGRRAIVAVALPMVAVRRVKLSGWRGGRAAAARRARLGFTPVSNAPDRFRRDAGAQVRLEARRLAESWSGAGPALTGIAIVAFLMTAFIVLDYTFNQDPHRVLKVALGLLAIGGIMSRPRFGLLLLPVITPFLGWVPPTPIPGLNALNVLLFAVFGTYALGAVLARRPVMRPGRLGPAIVLLVALAALSIVRGAIAPTGYGYGAYPASLNLFRSVMSFALYFILLAMARGERDRRHVAWAVLVGLLLESLVTIQLGRNGSGGRATGSIGQSNELAGYLALFSVLAAAVALGARSWLARLTAAGIFVAGSVGIMLSLSRGGMLALLGGLAVVAWRSSRWMFGVLLLLLALSPFWLPDYVKDRISQSSVESDVGDPALVDSASELRLLTWRAILEVVTHHPIDGVGFTGLQYVLPDVGAALGLGDVKDSAHNTYLRILAEMGVFGLLAFLWLMWSIWRLADDALLRARSRLDRSLAVGLSGAVAAMAISCAFGDRFWSPVVASSFWVLCALVEDAVIETRTKAVA